MIVEYLYQRSRKKVVDNYDVCFKWNGAWDSKELVRLPISVDFFVVRFYTDGYWTEMSIKHIQNGREDEIFSSDELEDSDTFQKIVDELKQKGFMQVMDYDYVGYAM